jgi:hypothetical protein
MRFCIGLLLLIASSSLVPGQESDPRAAVLASFKTALEKGEVKEMAALVAGRHGEILRRLAEPYSRAAAASDRLDAALVEKNINWSNPFAAGVRPLADLQLDIVELAREDNQDIVRVRFGPRGRTQEETLALVQEGGAWRVSLPADLRKDLARLASREDVDRQAKNLDALAEILETLAREVANGSLKNRNDVVLRLAKLVHEKGLGEKPASDG